MSTARPLRALTLTLIGVDCKTPPGLSSECSHLLQLSKHTSFDGQEAKVSLGPEATAPEEVVEVTVAYMYVYMYICTVDIPRGSIQKQRLADLRASGDASGGVHAKGGDVLDPRQPRGGLRCGW